MNDRDIRRKFFYATDEVRQYDQTISLVVPYYKELHEMMLRLVAGAPRLSTRPEESHLVLDIGSGTGAEAHQLLLNNPNARLVGVDLCEEMHVEFRANATAQGIPEDRYTLVTADILDDDTLGIIRGQALEKFHRDDFDVVTSAFTLHHFKREQRLKVFQLVNTLLAKDGVLVLGDLFDYTDESPWLTENISSWELNWISTNFLDMSRRASSEGDPGTSGKYLDLKKRWIDHYERDNDLDSVTIELDQLQNAGFRQVGNPFRYWQIGLIWALK